MYASLLHLICRVNADVLSVIALFRVVELARFLREQHRGWKQLQHHGQHCGPAQQREMKI